MALDIFEKDFIRDVKFIKEELIDEAEVGEINETEDPQVELEKLYRQKKELEAKIKAFEEEHLLNAAGESKARRSVMLYNPEDSGNYDFSLLVKGDKMIRLRDRGKYKGFEAFTAEKAGSSSKAYMSFVPNTSAKKMGAKEKISVTKGKPLNKKFPDINAARLWFAKL